MKFAIYGFYFDREFSFDGIKITPIGELSSSTYANRRLKWAKRQCKSATAQ